MDEWLRRDDGTRIWLDPLQLEDAEMFAQLALETPRSETEVRTSTAS